MKDLAEIPYHKLSEDIVDVLIKKTQNDTPLFFRVQVAYFLAKVAASMRTTIDTLDRGSLPVNVYAINLAPSGFGKGHSTNIIEEQIINQFRYNFTQHTFPAISDQSLQKIASVRAQRDGTDYDDELIAVQKEFNSLGSLLFSFSEGTSPAVKQMRHKVLMAECGAINFEMDEMGSNLMGNIEVLTTFLELYDVGKVKAKLTKNTSESKRSEEIDGRSPTNMLLFGTPAKLLNGGAEESEFYSLLETGYARRCLFGYSNIEKTKREITPEEVFKLAVDKTTNNLVSQLSQYFGRLANPAKYGTSLIISEEATLLLIEYKLRCENEAMDLSDHEEIRKAEISHRYFKALKLAGAYAFVDESPEVTIDHIYSAIKLTEDCGEAFKKILNREKAHMKLARYIAEIGRDVTNADMVEDLPFYPNTAARKNEMMNLARAWGYKNNIIIKSHIEEGIEFYSGETLEVTDLDKLNISYGSHFAYNYLSEPIKFGNIARLARVQDMNWINHYLINGKEGKGHRNSLNILAGFNMVVLDIDGTATIDMVRELLDEYNYLIYTTKSHTPQANRFRLIMPTNYVLKLDEEEFKDFMQNVYAWVPFEVDDQTFDRCRKWACNENAEVYINVDDEYGQTLKETLTDPAYHITTNASCKMLDALPFIPKTSRNEEYKSNLANLENLDNIERWFASRMTSGQRNNQLFKYAMMLASSGLDVPAIRERVIAFNDKMKDKISVKEIDNTVITTLAKRLQDGRVKSK